MNDNLWAPILFLVMLCLLARLTLKNWSAPGAFFPLFWLWLIGFSLLSAPEYFVWEGALWWILVSLGIFSFGSMVGGHFGRERGRYQNTQGIRNVPFPGINHLIIYAFIGQVAYIYLFDLFVPNMFIDKPPLFIQPLLSFSYVGPILGGMSLASCSTKRERFVALLPIFPSLVWLFSVSGRSGLVSLFTFYFAGYVSVRVWREKGRPRLFTWKTIFASQLILITIFFLALLNTQVRGVLGSGYPIGERLRIGVNATEAADLIYTWVSFRSGIFGHIHSFSFWFERAWYQPPDPKFGKYMFAGPLDLFAFSRREPFESFAIEKDVWSNVYTLFRPVIGDFTLWGSLLVFFAYGMIAGWAYMRVAGGSRRHMFFLIIFYMYALSIGGHAFSYNTIVLAFLFAGGYLCWIERKKSQIAGWPRKVGFRS